MHGASWRALVVAGLTLSSQLVGMPLPQAVGEPPQSVLSYPPAPPRVAGLAPPLETPFLVGPSVIRRTLAFGPGGLQQTLDVYTSADPAQPVASARRPTVLLVHGGGWQLGDSGEWANEAIELVRSRAWTAVSLNYRLAPRSPWPAAYEDAAAAMRLLHARADELGIDIDRIGAIGDSVGGQLAGLLGEPAPDRSALRSVVTWSGINDLSGVLQQPSTGGCAPARQQCGYTGLARKVVRDLMGCEPGACPSAYRAGSPAAGVTSGHAATMSLSSAGEQIDPRQAWVLDAALSRHGVPSRVQVLPGSLHARGFQSTAWPASLRFLAATLTPESALTYPRPAVLTTLELPVRSAGRIGQPVVLRGGVRPAQPGSSVALQVRQPDGSWRLARRASLQASPDGTTYRSSWTPARAGTTVWRAVWRGGGGLHATLPRAVVVA